MQYQIRCKVFPGQFSGEFAVEGSQANGEKFSLFAPAKDVETDEPPTRDRSVEGWLKVTLWEQSGSLAIVKLAPLFSMLSASTPPFSAARISTNGNRWSSLSRSTRPLGSTRFWIG